MKIPDSLKFLDEIIKAHGSCPIVGCAKNCPIYHRKCLEPSALERALIARARLLSPQELVVPPLF